MGASATAPICATIVAGSPPVPVPITTTSSPGLSGTTGLSTLTVTGPAGTGRLDGDVDAGASVIAFHSGRARKDAVVSKTCCAAPDDAPEGATLWTARPLEIESGAAWPGASWIVKASCVVEEVAGASWWPTLRVSATCAWGVWAVARHASPAIRSW